MMLGGGTARMRSCFEFNRHRDDDVLLRGAPPWDTVLHPVSDMEWATLALAETPIDVATVS